MTPGQGLRECRELAGVDGEARRSSGTCSGLVLLPPAGGGARLRSPTVTARVSQKRWPRAPSRARSFLSCLSGQCGV